MPSLGQRVPGTPLASVLTDVSLWALCQCTACPGRRGAGSRSVVFLNFGAGGQKMLGRTEFFASEVVGFPY